MLTIVFYTTDGPAAKARSRELAAVKNDYTRVINAGFWDSTVYVRCDAVEIMPDVPGWQRKRIMEVYSDKVVEPGTTEREVVEEQQSETTEELVISTEKKAVHKGGGRWFVMVGEDKLSGPHDKVEAQRLASEAA